MINVRAVMFFKKFLLIINYIDTYIEVFIGDMVEIRFKMFRRKEICWGNR